MSDSRPYDEATALHAFLGSTSDLIYFLDRDLRYRYVGAAAASVLGRTPESLIGRTVRDAGISAEAAARFHAQSREVMQSGRVQRGEETFETPDGAVILDIVIAPVAAGGEPIGVVVVSRDVTERRRAEANAGFLSRLNETLQPLTNPDEIMATTARMLGEFLRADRCAYAQVEEDEDHFTITGDYAPNTFSIIGRFSLSSFGPAHRLALEGKPYVVEDAELDPRVEGFRDAYRQTEIAAVIQVTLKKAGRFVAGMAVHQKTPRKWRADEIELVQTVVNRCWESLERARAASLLERSEERYRSLVRILTSVVWTVDPEGAFVTEQPSWAAYTGQTREEYSGFGWVNALHPDDRANLLAVWQEAARTRTIYRTSGRLWHAATNEFRWFEVAAAPLLNDDGSVREWIGTISDVHEERVAQAHVSDQRTWLQAVLDSLPVPVAFIEPESSTVRFTNRAAQLAIGEAGIPSELTSRIAHGERLDHVQISLDLATGTRTLLVSGQSLAPMHGHAATGIIAFQDITALKEIEEELRRANQLKDEFLATVSHELRTPLTAIIGWTVLLNDNALDAGTAREALHVIEQNARAQARLIEDLVDVSRIVAGKMNLDMKPIAVAPVVRAAIASVRAAADEKQITITERIDEDATILGDAARVQQIVWNLVSNAARFTPPSGEIAVSVTRNDAEIEITVTDTGEGIDPSFLPHVFERFRQDDMSVTRRHGGLGLGLAISRHLAELHGGTIRVESAGRGTGATFRVRLPIHAGDATTSSPDRRASTEALRDVRVLIVEDAADARSMLERVLEHAGAIVASAASASEAFDLAASFHPDVLLSDIGMPDEDGYSLLRRLRASGFTNPAIALTAYAGDENRQAAIEAGYAAHVAKPADPRHVVEAIVNLRKEEFRRRS
ncbi:MAG: PAS domain-containing protein [Acidobacteriota bacterium]|nr:PAS domain-containing protein [Acidobacteriota bacterium]